MDREFIRNKVMSLVQLSAHLYAILSLSMDATELNETPFLAEDDRRWESQRPLMKLTKQASSLRYNHDTNLSQRPGSGYRSGFRGIAKTTPEPTTLRTVLN